MPEVRWEHMFPDELEKAFAGCPLVWFAYGLCEPHGPQNAIGLDELKAHGIAVRAAREHGGIVAPPDFWHIHEMGGSASWAMNAIGEVERTWLTCIPPWQHFRSVLYHIRQADAIGFHAAILITGHYGPNWMDLNTLVALVQPHVGLRLYSLPDFEANQWAFGEQRRRTKIIPRFFNERDCLKPVYGVLFQTSQRWHRVKFSEHEQNQLESYMQSRSFRQTNVAEIAA